MSDRIPFSQIKLQYLLEMVTDHELDDNALRVALYLALKHADHVTGESRPSFETIGAAIGKHAKSIKRALNKVEAAGYMTVERGTNKGKSSRYRPTEAALKRATERRREGDKVVPLSRTKGGQPRPQSGTELSGKGGQDRPPNKEQELRKSAGEAELVFVPENSAAVREWENLCDRHIGIRLGHLLPGVSVRGQRGFLLPGRWPPVDRQEWAAAALRLKSLGNTSEAEAAHG